MLLSSLGLNETWTHQYLAHQELPEHGHIPTEKMEGGPRWRYLTASFMQASVELPYTQSPLDWHLQLQGKLICSKAEVLIYAGTYTHDRVKKRKVSIFTLIIWNGDFERLWQNASNKCFLKRNTREKTGIQDSLEMLWDIISIYATTTKKCLCKHHNTERALYFYYSSLRIT